MIKVIVSKVRAWFELAFLVGLVLFQRREYIYSIYYKIQILAEKDSVVSYILICLLTLIID